MLWVYDVIVSSHLLPATGFLVCWVPLLALDQANWKALVGGWGGSRLGVAAKDEIYWASRLGFSLDTS